MAGSVVAAASGSATAGAAISCNKPTGTADGDVMVAFLGDDWGAFGDSSAPGGWTLRTSLDRGSDNLHCKIWTKTASSEGASYSFNIGVGANGCVTIVTTRGTTESVLTDINWAAASTSRDAPSITGVTASPVALCYALLEANATTNTFTPPSGMNEESDVQPDVWACHSVASLTAPPEPTGTRTFTSSTAGASAGGIQASIVVADASSAAFPRRIVVAPSAAVQRAVL